jgi:hypothetical protein
MLDSKAGRFPAQHRTCGRKGLHFSVSRVWSVVLSFCISNETEALGTYSSKAASVISSKDGKDVETE